MGNLLEISLFGGITIKENGETITGLASRKAEALLAYLAYTGHPHPRETLADLFWDDRSQSQALGNLRVILSSLRQRLGPYVIITRQTVAFNTESHYWLDTAEFVNQVTIIRKQANETEILSDEDVLKLDQAVALYRADFLAGFYVRQAYGFEEWVIIERERLRRLACETLQSLLDYQLRTASYQAGIDRARRLLELDPLREETHRQLMRLLALDGQRNAALAQYGTCRTILATELGVAPAPKTTVVYERIRAARSIRHHNLPTQLTSFFGRQTELIWIAERLAQPSYRLLTLVGSGGIGKTRVAIRAATEQIGRFLNGVYFISLAPVSSTEFIISALADTLGFSLFGQETPKQELLNFLFDKEMLLVFDNFEHLLAGAELVLDILKQAPAVKILVTSRERLNFQAEWVLEIRGLSYPASDDKGDLKDYSGVQLFVERSSRVKADFSLSEEIDAAVTSVCQLVEGMPLGIELAAASIGTYTCQQIAARIERNLDFLNTSMRDVPQRHRSLQAVFDHSWQLLSEGEKGVLKKLSVFQGPFGLKAARAVAGATPTFIRTLVNKSLLRQNQAKAYDIHPLLKQYVAEKLAATPPLEAGTKALHCQYYAQFLHQREQALKGDQQIKTLAEIGVAIENIRAAWQWAIAHKDFESMPLALEGLYLFYWARSWLQEGQEAFEQAAQVVLTLGQEDNLLLAKIWVRQAEFYIWLSDYDEAKTLLHNAIEICQTYQDQPELALAFELWGRIEYYLGSYTRAREYFQQSLELYRQIDDKFGIAQALNSLANTICDERADYAQAQPFYEESLAIARQIGDQFGVAKVLVNLGAAAQDLQNYAEAKQFYKESLSIYKEIDYRHGQSASLNYLGQVACLLGEYKPAQTLLQECLDINRETGNRRTICDALKQLANVAYEMGEHQKSKQQYHEALRLAVDIKATDFVLDILIGLAKLFEQEGQKERALELLAFVLHHPTGGQVVKDRAYGLLPDLETGLSPEVVTVCHQRGKTRTFEDITLELLEYGLV